MNAPLIRKRNQSLQWIWLSLATGEFLVWIASGVGARHGTAEGFGLVWMIMLMLVIPLLVIEAPVHYFFACAHYVSAKGRNNAYLCAVFALLFSLSVTPFCVAAAAVYNCLWVAHFGIPVVFALAALPFKLMQDRSAPDESEVLT